MRKYQQPEYFLELSYLPNYKRDLLDFEAYI